MNDDNMTLRRNADAVVGFVNFPMDTIENSGEGGCFVRLVVMDGITGDGFCKAYLPCCGGFNQFSMDECFLGDDLFDPSYPDDANDEAWKERDTRFIKCTERYFPNLGENDIEEVYGSR